MPSRIWAGILPLPPPLIAGSGKRPCGEYAGIPRFFQFAGLLTGAIAVVAVRYSDLVVPDSRARVIVLSEWYLLKGLINNRRVGLTTDQEVLDAEF